MAVLVEVKQIKTNFPEFRIPAVVQKVFTKFEDFRTFINFLDKIVDLYNYLITDTADVDFNLITEEIKVD